MHMKQRQDLVKVVTLTIMEYIHKHGACGVGL